MMSRFIAKADCFLDTETDLEWERNGHGRTTWDDAVRLCETLPDGWRLPTIKELMTIVERNTVSPASELPGLRPSMHWSSSTSACYSIGAWSVDFYYGVAGYRDKTSHGYIRCVRKGTPDETRRMA